MTHSAIERRIFIVGVPRSGTTLVQSLLASHTAMTSFTESHFFRKNFSIVPLLSLADLDQGSPFTAVRVSGRERRRTSFCG